MSAMNLSSRFVAWRAAASRPANPSWPIRSRYSPASWPAASSFSEPSANSRSSSAIATCGRPSAVACSAAHPSSTGSRGLATSPAWHTAYAAPGSSSSSMSSRRPSRSLDARIRHGSARVRSVPSAIAATISGALGAERGELGHPRDQLVDPAAARERPRDLVRRLEHVVVGLDQLDRRAVAQQQLVDRDLARGDQLDIAIDHPRRRERGDDRGEHRDRAGADRVVAALGARQVVGVREHLVDLAEPAGAAGGVGLGERDHHDQRGVVDPGARELVAGADQDRRPAARPRSRAAPGRRATARAARARSGGRGAAGRARARRRAGRRPRSRSSRAAPGAADRRARAPRAGRAARRGRRHRPAGTARRARRSAGRRGVAADGTRRRRRRQRQRRRGARIDRSRSTRPTADGECRARPGR